MLDLESDYTALHLTELYPNQVDRLAQCAVLVSVSPVFELLQRLAVGVLLHTTLNSKR